MVVYADILFILNAYVTYALLLVTDLLCREKGSRVRRTFAALLGGGYSFLIFVPLPQWALVLTRLAAAAVFVFVAYGKGSRKRFLLLFGGFFLVNFVFAGLMFALWSVIRPQSMLYSGSIVYFNINTLLLVVLTAVCYAVLYAVHLFLNARKPRNSLFRLRVTLDGRSVTADAFLDSGNSLTEPFSGLPVILMTERVLAPLLEGYDLTDSETAVRLRLRHIPCHSLTGTADLLGLRPQSVAIEGAAVSVSSSDVYIAMTKEPLCGGDFDALLHPNLLEETKVIVCKTSN